MTNVIIQQTENWIKSVVIDLNFCPFAAKALLQKSIRYQVLTNVNVAQSVNAVISELQLLDVNPQYETAFIIFSNDFSSFDDYLKLVKKVESQLKKNHYSGIYQIASFHPEYIFAGSDDNDPANYTNRSVYPMIHILREESLTKALSLYPHPETIPENNIKLAHQKGLQYMQLLRAACF